MTCNRWVVEGIDSLYNAKCKADAADLADGLPLQPLGAFVTEQLLLSYGLRRLAELHCYELLMAVKSHRGVHKRVALFAQFLGLVECEKLSTCEALRPTNQNEASLLLS